LECGGKFPPTNVCQTCPSLLGVEPEPVSVESVLDAVILLVIFDLQAMAGRILITSAIRILKASPVSPAYLACRFGYNAARLREAVKPFASTLPLRHFPLE